MGKIQPEGGGLRGMAKHKINNSKINRIGAIDFEKCDTAWKSRYLVVKTMKTV